MISLAARGSRVTIFRKVGGRVSAILGLWLPSTFRVLGGTLFVGGVVEDVGLQSALMPRLLVGQLLGPSGI